MIVLADMSTAPAASGMAITLYPAAHHSDRLAPSFEPA